MDLGSPATTTTITLNLTKKEFLEIKYAIQREDLAFLQEYVKTTSNGKLRGVNLSKDPLLNVMIACDSKDAILLKLINMMTPDALLATNKVGDTALHVAAAKDRAAVVTALIDNNRELIDARNENHETPLLKAAHFGSRKTFYHLLSHGSNIFAKNKYGSNVLHCAILGNNPDLALKIAQQHQYLSMFRNGKGLTPLQVLVTIPEAFQSSWEWGHVESLIDAIIPLNSLTESKEPENKRDEEALNKYEDSKLTEDWVEDNEDNVENDKLLKASKATSSKKFMKKCQCYAIEGAFQVRFYIIVVLKKLFNKKVEKLETQKKKHAQTMKLIAYLARDPGYWDFIQYGMLSDGQKRLSFRNYENNDDDEVFVIDDEKTTYSSQEGKTCCLEIKDLIKKQNKLIQELKKEIKKKKEPEPRIWNESPLINGAKLGLHDFVEQILKVYPKSAEIKDLKGRNVLQVAIKHGHVKIVKIIAKMIKGPNPVLPSWLLSDVKVKGAEQPPLLSFVNIKDDEMNTDDDEMDNTILHYAAETTIEGEGLALQMQQEIKWFEMVKDLLPENLVISRNAKGKTAHELFIEKHEEMVKSGRGQLMEIGKTCSGLLAAVVFATSFNTPGGNDSDSFSTGSSKNNMTNTGGNHSVGFKLFAHAYTIGLSLATCSLILFLSLLGSSYRTEAFRNLLPTKYILAGASFVFSLLAFMVAFVCNVYLSIYGRGTSKAMNLMPLILELTGFPFLCIVTLFIGGFGLRFSSFILKVFYR